MQFAARTCGKTRKTDLLLMFSSVYLHQSVSGTSFFYKKSSNPTKCGKYSNLQMKYVTGDLYPQHSNFCGVLFNVCIIITNKVGQYSSRKRKRVKKGIIEKAKFFFIKAYNYWNPQIS